MWFEETNSNAAEVVGSMLLPDMSRAVKAVVMATAAVRLL